jgi:hypothetical protein
MTKRRNFSDKFKATVALEALRGDKTMQEIAAKRPHTALDKRTPDAEYFEQAEIRNAA